MISLSFFHPENWGRCFFNWVGNNHLVGGRGRSKQKLLKVINFHWRRFVWLGTNLLMLFYFGTPAMITIKNCSSKLELSLVLYKLYIYNTWMAVSYSRMLPPWITAWLRIPLQPQKATTNRHQAATLSMSGRCWSCGESQASFRGFGTVQPFWGFVEITKQYLT